MCPPSDPLCIDKSKFRVFSSHFPFSCALYRPSMRNQRKSYGETRARRIFPSGDIHIWRPQNFQDCNPPPLVTVTLTQPISTIIMFWPTPSPSKRTSYENSSCWTAFTRILVVLFACNHASNNFLRDTARAQIAFLIVLATADIFPHVQVSRDKVGHVIW